jgi:hypothetical protein
MTKLSHLKLVKFRNLKNLKSVNCVADVDVFDFLVEDERESARLFSVLLRQEERVAFRRQRGHLLVRAKSETLRHDQPRDGVRVEMRPDKIEFNQQFVEYFRNSHLKCHNLF